MQTHIIKVVIFCVASFFINGAFLYGTHYGDDKTCPDVFTGKGNFTLQEHVCSGKQWNNVIKILTSDDKEFARFETTCHADEQQILLSNNNELIGYINIGSRAGGTTQDLNTWSITDCNNNLIASLSEGDLKAEIDTQEIASVFIIKDLNDHLLGYISNSEYTSTYFSIRDNSKRLVAVVERNVGRKANSNNCKNPEWVITFYSDSLESKIVAFLVATKAMSEIMNGSPHHDALPDSCSDTLPAIVVGSTLGGTIVLLTMGYFLINCCVNVHDSIARIHPMPLIRDRGL